jgi:hypothetical protein
MRSAGRSGLIVGSIDDELDSRWVKFLLGDLLDELSLLFAFELELALDATLAEVNNVSSTLLSRGSFEM